MENNDMLTFEEMMEKIASEYDPDLICEMLYITTEDLIERFEDRFRDPEIINKFGWLAKEEMPE